MIPEWFNLDYYKNVISTEQWLEEILYRTEIYILLSKQTTPLIEIKESFTKVIVNRDRRPITDFLGKTILKPVKDTSAFDIELIFKIIRNSDFYRTREKDFIQYKSFSWHACYQNGERTRPNPPFTDGCPITIDLNFSDEEIKESFEAWLKNMRKSGAKPTSQSKYFIERFKEWTNFKVLPYFDLYLWGKLNNIKYTNEMLGNILWPAELSHKADSNLIIANRVRQVVKPKIKEIFNKTTVNRLWQYCELMGNYPV